MTIEPIAEDRLRVWLTDEEMEQWGLTQPQPPMGRVRRLVRQIVVGAGWSPSRRVTAELMPVEGGGVLLVTPRSDASAVAPVVYRLPDGDALVDVIRQWGYIEAAEEPLCSLYQCEGGYDLVVYPTQSLSRRRQDLLSEYGIPIGSGEGVAARCGEYGTLIRAGWVLTEREPMQPEPQGPRR